MNILWKVLLYEYIVGILGKYCYMIILWKVLLYEYSTKSIAIWIFYEKYCCMNILWKLLLYEYSTKSIALWIFYEKYCCMNILQEKYCYMNMKVFSTNCVLLVIYWPCLRGIGHDRTFTSSYARTRRSTKEHKNHAIQGFLTPLKFIQGFLTPSKFITFVFCCLFQTVSSENELFQISSEWHFFVWNTDCRFVFFSFSEIF